MESATVNLIVDWEYRKDNEKIDLILDFFKLVNGCCSDKNFKPFMKSEEFGQKKEF